MLAKSYFDTYLGDADKPPVCDNLENERCLIRVIENYADLIGHCESQCEVKDYSGEMQSSDY